MLNNTHTLNKYGNIVGCDIIRGAGFNTNTNNAKLTYNLIMKDMVKFVNGFLKNQYFNSSEKMKASYWDYYSNQLHITIIAGNDISVPLIKLAKINPVSQKKNDANYILDISKTIIDPESQNHNNQDVSTANDSQTKVFIDYRFVLENAWLGYSSMRDLNYGLSAFGLINPTLINFISTWNF